MLKQNDLQTDINHLAARIGQIGRVAEEDGK